MKYDTLNESQRIAQLEINYLATCKLLQRLERYNTLRIQDVFEIHEALQEARALMPQYNGELYGLR